MNAKKKKPSVKLVVRHTRTIAHLQKHSLEIVRDGDKKGNSLNKLTKYAYLKKDHSWTNMDILREISETDKLMTSFGRCSAKFNRPWTSVEIRIKKRIQDYQKQIRNSPGNSKHKEIKTSNFLSIINFGDQKSRVRTKKS